MKKIGFTLDNVLNFINRLIKDDSAPSQKAKRQRRRVCRIEELEQREMLSVNMLNFALLTSQHNDLNDPNFIDTGITNSENIAANASTVAAAPELNPFETTLSQEEFDYIREEKYVDLGLSVNMVDYNVIVITANNLTDAVLRSALTTSSTNSLDNLIVVRTGTTTTQNTITLTGGELEIYSGNVTIVSLGNEKLTLDANGSNLSVFNIGSNAIVGFAGLKITRAYGYLAHGLTNYGILKMTVCEIVNNTTNNEGGGIFNVGTLDVLDCTISNNLAGTGGGVWNEGTLTVKGGEISNNRANQDFSQVGGGGIFNSGTLVVWNCTISDNVTWINQIYRPAGGISNSGTLTMIGGEISGSTGIGIRNFSTTGNAYLISRLVPQPYIAISALRMAQTSFVRNK